MKVRTVWCIAATYMGAIIGAGFASGQELLRFFVIFGWEGIWGIILAGVLFALLGWMAVSFCHHNQITSYGQLTELLFTRKVGQLLELIISIMLWIGVTVMLAGSGALFAEHLEMSKYVGLGVTAGILIVALMFRGEGVAFLNILLIPFLIAVAMLVSINTVLSAEEFIINPVNTHISMLSKTHWSIASLVYVAYNMILGLVILSSLDLSDYISSSLGAVLGGIMLGIIGLTSVVALLIHSNEVYNYQIPLLYLASLQASWIKIPFTLALWFAMVTTAVANGFGLVKRVENLPYFDYRLSILAVMVTTLPLAQLPFSSLVATLYPILGYIGLIVVGLVYFRIIYQYLQRK